MRFVAVYAFEYRHTLDTNAFSAVASVGCVCSTGNPYSFFPCGTGSTDILPYPLSAAGAPNLTVIVLLTLTPSLVKSVGIV